MTNRTLEELIKLGAKLVQPRPTVQQMVTLVAANILLGILALTGGGLLLAAFFHWLISFQGFDAASAYLLSGGVIVTLSLAVYIAKNSIARREKPRAEIQDLAELFETLKSSFLQGWTRPHSDQAPSEPCNQTSNVHPLNMTEEKNYERRS